jgi:hypothetical protein
MDLVVEPDTYTPSMDDVGNYIDKIPTTQVLKRGIRCPCGSRKDKIHHSYSAFSLHIKTKTHQKWLEDVNNNKTNYYIENRELKDTLANQRLIIANLEKEIALKIKTVDFLTQSLVSLSKTVEPVVDNLIDFD